MGPSVHQRYMIIVGIILLLPEGNTGDP